MENFNTPVKISYNQTTRRTVLPKITTWTEFEDKVRLLFNFPPSQALSVSYRDGDDDTITLSTDLELLELLNQPGTVKLIIDTVPIEVFDSTDTAAQRAFETKTVSDDGYEQVDHSENEEEMPLIQLDEKEPVGELVEIKEETEVMEDVIPTNENDTNSAGGLSTSIADQKRPETGILPTFETADPMEGSSRTKPTDESDSSLAVPASLPSSTLTQSQNRAAEEVRAGFNELLGQFKKLAQQVGGVLEQNPQLMTTTMAIREQILQLIPLTLEAFAQWMRNQNLAPKSGERGCPWKKMIGPCGASDGTKGPDRKDFGKKIGELGQTVGGCVGEWGQRFGEEMGGLGKKVGEEVGGLGKKVGQELGGLGAKVGQEIGGLGQKFGEEVAKQFGASSSRQGISEVTTSLPGSWPHSMMDEKQPSQEPVLPASTFGAIRRRPNEAQTPNQQEWLQKYQQIVARQAAVVAQIQALVSQGSTEMDQSVSVQARQLRRQFRSAQRELRRHARKVKRMCNRTEQKEWKTLVKAQKWEMRRQMRVSWKRLEELGAESDWSEDSDWSEEDGQEETQREGEEGVLRQLRTMGFLDDELNRRLVRGSDKKLETVVDELLNQELEGRRREMESRK